MFRALAITVERRKVLANMREAEIAFAWVRVDKGPAEAGLDHGEGEAHKGRVIALAVGGERAAERRRKAGPAKG